VCQAQSGKQREMKVHSKIKSELDKDFERILN
jgi:hypothetical protein